MNVLHPKPVSADGFSLIEVMVAIVIISFGVLGMAALQFLSLRGNNQSYERTQATALAYEIADQMRANAARANAGAFDLGASAPANSSNCASQSCTDQEMAAYELRQWYQRLTTVLPSSTARIQRSPSPCPATGCMQTVTIMWDENRNGASGLGCDPSNNGDMSCVRISFYSQAIFVP
jgi:type IV pilus assembly protein PilV